MMAIRLSKSIENRLNTLALETGRAKSTLEYIDDLKVWVAKLENPREIGEALSGAKLRE